MGCIGGRVVITAFAKISLSLRVVGTRPDGFHDVDILTVGIRAPCDTMRVGGADEMSLSVTGPFASGVPADASNLVWRAAVLLERTLRIELHKEVPSEAGLGGGSSDAAALLREFGGTVELAAELGSDVPFFFSGAPARMTGRGEILDTVSIPSLHVVVGAPAFGCSTPAVYRAWDELGGPRSERVTRYPGFDDDVVNDLEPAAEHVEPRLREFRARLEEAIGRDAMLSGSGSAYSAGFASADEARAAADAARAAGITSIWATTTIA